jgi:hypothetical protein
LHVPAHKCPTYSRIAAIIDHKKKRNNALGSPLVTITSTIQAAKAHQWLISPWPNSSSIQPSVPRGQSFWPSTLPISISKPHAKPKYMHLRLKIIPDKIIIHYNLCNIVTPDRWVYMDMMILTSS